MIKNPLAFLRRRKKDDLPGYLPPTPNFADLAPAPTMENAKLELEAISVAKDAKRIFGGVPNEVSTGNLAGESSGRLPVLKTRASGRPYVIVGTRDEVRTLVRNPPPKNTQILLSGDLVIIASDDEPTVAIDNYHRQTDRIIKPLNTLSKRSSHFTLKVWLHDDAIQLKHALPSHKHIAFAIDQYLAFGRTLRRDHIQLVTGYATTMETILHNFSFYNGSLVAIDEINLPAIGNSRFAAEFDQLLSRFQKKETTIVADPLPAPAPENNVIYLDSEIYAKPIRYPLIDESAEPSFFVGNGLSLITGALASMIYCASIIAPYNTYNSATEAFRRVAATIPKNDLAFGSNQIKTMTERRIFLSDPRDQDNTIPFLRRLTGVLSGSNTLIKRVSINQTKSRPDEPDIALTVEMKKPQDSKVSILDIAKPLLDQISDRMGVDFHLAHNGYQDRNNADKSQTVTLTIQGDLKKKP